MTWAWNWDEGEGAVVSLDAEGMGLVNHATDEVRGIVEVVIEVGGLFPGGEGLVVLSVGELQVGLAVEDGGEDL